MLLVERCCGLGVATAVGDGEAVAVGVAVGDDEPPLLPPQAASPAAIVKHAATRSVFKVSPSSG